MPQCPLYLNSVQPFSNSNCISFKIWLFFFKELAEKANTEERLEEIKEEFTQLVEKIKQDL